LVESNDFAVDNRDFGKLSQGFDNERELFAGLTAYSSTDDP
jgi:hypothetical protein